MAQQTAVEWLVEQLRMQNPLYTKNEMIDIAKQMFQQQIEAAWKRGDGEHDKVADKLAKQYYTETYTNESR
jgi:hypothetical protein